MTTGPMMQGLTNRSTGNDSDVTGLLSASDAVAPSVSSVAATETADPNAAPNPDSWRVEVAARLERYRTRRKPRTPRYPSLLLPFDAPESWSRSAPAAGSGSLATASASGEQEFTGHTFAAHGVEEPMRAGTQDVAGTWQVSSKQAPDRTPDRTSDQTPDQTPDEAAEQAQDRAQNQAPEVSAKVIEFPRSAAIPVFHPSDLADPVFDFDRPRIVEAPEIVPPPPALGGILIDPPPQETSDRQSDFVSALPSAPIARRALAALVDGAVVAAALAASAGVFFHFNPFRLNLTLHPILNFVRGPVAAIAGAFVVVAVLQWAAYQYLFVVYTGATPGLRATGLRLAGFDGSALNRRLRRWRVLASFLSAFSAGLGYFWCILDQNGLCWHDRITRTHVQTTEAE
ncbi:MAG: RDD family protein [Terriglobales bacterium]